MKKAVVLLSGGLDSATTLFYALDRGYKPSCLIFRYGQRHQKEIRCAKAVARAGGCSYRLLDLPMPWKGSALLDHNMSLPDGRRRRSSEIPATYVPARNIIFLSLASGYAEAIGARAVFIGANAIDYSGYPDCRPEFYRAFQAALRAGTKTGIRGRPIRIHTPLIRKTKAQIIRLGMRLKVPYRLTWSCYGGGRRPCGHCDSCLIRARGFAEAGIMDPILKVGSKE